MMQVKRIWLVWLSCMLVAAGLSSVAAAAEAEVSSSTATNVVFEDFEDMSDVYLTKSVASDFAQLSQASMPSPVVHGLSSAKLDYDFTGSSGTSAAYLRFYGANNSPGRTIEGSPSKIGFWVHGAGYRHWIRAQLEDANGNKPVLDFTATTTVIDGWQYVSANVPTNLAAPFKLNYIYYVETSSKTAGTLYFDQISLIYGNSELLELQWSDIRPMQAGETITPKLLAAKHGSKQVDVIALQQAIVSSSNPEVAAVNSEGNLEALAPGETVLSAHYNGRAASYVLTVVDELVEPGSIAIKGPLTLVPSEETELAVYAIFNQHELVDVTAAASIVSSNEEIVRIENGKLRGISYGTATITASFTTNSGAELVTSYELEVKPGELRSIAIKDVFSAVVGGEPITATVYGTYRIEGEKPITEGVTFSIDNPQIAAIDPMTGVITAITPGVTTVRAEVNGQTVQQILVVTNAISAPKHELRGAWISTVENIDWPAKGDTNPASQRADFVALLDELQAAGINAVFAQVRPTADSFFPSEYFPWSHWLTGEQGVAPDDHYDPLAFMIEEAHKRNMEFHAWINPFRISMHNQLDALVETHPARQHPDWVVEYEGKLYFNPGVAEARSYILEAVNEIVEKYDVDGIHMDDYFYPYPSSQVFNDASQYEAYVAGGGTLGLADWRRSNVNMVVSGLYETIKASKSYVKFGISPFGIWKNKASDPTGSATNGLESYSAIYADTRTWIKLGWVDYIAPQIYWHFGYNAAAYDVLVDWWLNEVEQYAQVHDVHLYIGHATYKVGTTFWEHPDQLPAQLRYNQDKQVSGSILFSSNHFLANPLGILDAIKQTYAKPALIPAMPWLGGEAPKQPMLAQTKNVSSGVQLKWKAGNKDEEPRYYAIYRAPGKQAPSTATTEHLLATVAATAENMQLYIDQTAVAGETYTYAITAVSRLHVESEASKSSTIAVKKVKNEH